MDAMLYYAAHSWNPSHHLSTSEFAAGPCMKTSNTSQNNSVTANQFPAQMNSNVLAQLQQWRCQRKVLQVRTQSDEEDLTTTKALTRGTEDNDDGNVGCTQDPCRSTETSAKGTSANCAETTLVILESMLHEMQDQPQSSLPLTLRLPIDGEPCECKQEVVDSIVTAGCTNGTVELAEPTKIADVDRTPTLGREPVAEACRVDEGDRTEHKPQL